MRELRLAEFYRDESVKPGVQDRAGVKEDIDQARENGARIIASATRVENFFEEIITLYFFGTGKKEKIEFFRETVLEAHFFSFHSKWKLFRAILRELTPKGFMSNEERKDVCRAASEVISWRNAFAHGEVVYRDEALFLRYFEGGEKEQELSDEYWLGVEELFAGALRDVVGVRERMRKGL